MRNSTIGVIFQDGRYQKFHTEKTTTKLTNFPFDFELNGIQFENKSEGKLSPRSYPIQFERKYNTSFHSAV